MNPNDVRTYVKEFKNYVSNLSDDELKRHINRFNNQRINYKFMMNNRTWTIEEVDKDWLLEEYRKEYESATYCFGVTKYSIQTIYINDELCFEVKKQTLYHELMHCYLWSYVHNFNTIGEEALCDISANSHDTIHAIVNGYFKHIEEDLEK